MKLRYATSIMASLSSYLIRLCFFAIILAGIPLPTNAQDTVTGGFQGWVRHSQTDAPVKGALVEIVNEATGLTFSLHTDYQGRFYQGLLLPGVYQIRVSLPGFQTKRLIQRLRITNTGQVVPVPISLEPESTAGPSTSAAGSTVEDNDIRVTIETTDGRRLGSFNEKEVETFPLTKSLITDTFDALALLLPGVSPPPQTVGGVAGPGVGAGVGSSGQFSTNGLRSRANNFTVDGSDNNDEDIGVRRQGFVALIPQPIESVKEYQAITLLAPAQFGRNIGAQVNAVSKSGGNETHGTLYAFLNSSQLNARNFFDTTNGNDLLPVTAGNNQPVLLCPANNPTCLVNGVTSVAGGQRIL